MKKAIVVILVTIIMIIFIWCKGKLFPRLGSYINDIK